MTFSLLDFEARAETNMRLDGRLFRCYSFMKYEKPYIVLRILIDIRCLIGYFEKRSWGEVSLALGLFSRCAFQEN
jgi:hypothetical protein